jgi:DNA-directed RNA polymerase subunit RPC12/RpoP
MGTVLCIVCSIRDPEAIADGDGLLCTECATRWAVCLDCDEPFILAEATTSLRCEPCLVVYRRPARLAA